MARRVRRSKRPKQDVHAYLKLPRRADGLRQTIPLRYLSHEERREFLARATSELSG